MHVKCKGRGRQMVIKPELVSWLRGGGGKLKLLARINPQTALLNHKDNYMKYGVQRRGFRFKKTVLILTFYLRYIIYTETHSVPYPSVKFLCCLKKTILTDYVKNQELLRNVKGTRRNILHKINHKKANWIGHILRRNCLLRQVTE
jgi:hypothetical protein